MLFVLLLFQRGSYPAQEEAMADLDQRVTTLEHEVSALKARVVANDED